MPQQGAGARKQSAASGAKLAKKIGKKRSRVEAEEEEEELDDIQFGDVADDSSDSVDELDDFETKAAKFKQQLQREGRIATAERRDEEKRVVKSSVFSDQKEAATEGEIEQVAVQQFAKAQQQSTDELRDRITETVRALSSFKDQREDGIDREEYLTLLRDDLMELYDYNEFLMGKIVDMFPPHEAVEFIEAMEKERPLTIRVNTIKAKRRDLVQALVARGMNVEPLEKWSKVGLQVFESSVPVSGTIEYLGGHYMVQSAVSFIPVMALDPQENERILDMSAAPGGKTTYIAALMKNTGVLFANDVSEPRIKALSANIQRLGVTNCIVTNYDGIGYSRVMAGFDRVLLDAPCSGSGIIARDKSIKTSKTDDIIQRHSLLQRRLILSAIDCLKPGGYVVYSTCSFLVEEDEAVVDFVLRQRKNVQVVPVDLPFGRPGFTKYRHLRFHPDVQHSRRFFPHVHNMDGFFVCKLQKIAPTEETESSAVPAAARTKKDRKAKQLAAAVAQPAASSQSGTSSSSRVSKPPPITTTVQLGGSKKGGPTKPRAKKSKPAAAEGAVPAKAAPQAAAAPPAKAKTAQKEPATAVKKSKGGKDRRKEDAQ